MAHIPYVRGSYSILNADFTEAGEDPTGFAIKRLKSTIGGSVEGFSNLMYDTRAGTINYKSDTRRRLQDRSVAIQHEFLAIEAQ